MRPRSASADVVVVWGLLGSHPYGGMTWQVLHHLEGLRRLGYEPWYVEEHSRLVDPETRSPTADPTRCAAYVRTWLARVGMEDRWVLRTGDGCLGALDLAGLERLYRDAVGVLNLCGAQVLLPHHDAIQRLVYVNTDPGVLQIAVDEGHERPVAELDRHDVHVTYATNLRADDCLLPATRYDWVTTVPPVVCDWWQDGPPTMTPPGMTTVTHWGDQGQDVEWRGRTLTWRKDASFHELGLLDLPARSPWALHMAAAGLDAAAAVELRTHGWHVSDAASLRDPDAYRTYVVGSWGELSVAKEQNVALRTGWFSDRSACYLAAGRPVVVQDTAFDAALPAGDGLLPFVDGDGACAGVEAVAADHPGHARAAEEIAREHLDAEVVLAALLESAGLR